MATIDIPTLASLTIDFGHRFRAIVAGYEGSRGQPSECPTALDYDLQHLQLLLTANTQDMLQHNVLEEDCKLGMWMRWLLYAYKMLLVALMINTYCCMHQCI